MFNPTLGRFFQRDPAGYAGGSSNLYLYIRGRPMSGADPLGLAPLDLSGLAWAAREAMIASILEPPGGSLLGFRPPPAGYTYKPPRFEDSTIFKKCIGADSEHWDIARYNARNSEAFKNQAKLHAKIATLPPGAQGGAAGLARDKEALQRQANEVYAVQRAVDETVLRELLKVLTREQACAFWDCALKEKKKSAAPLEDLLKGLQKPGNMPAPKKTPP
jgi:hypothetical protein